MAFTSLFLDTSTGSVTSGMGSYISDLLKTIGVDLFEEDIDNVVLEPTSFYAVPILSVLMVPSGTFSR